MNIKIISASVRDGRNSHRVALFFRKFIADNGLGDVEVLDLKAYNFPLFNERLQFMKEPPPEVLDFASRINSADAVLIVTPEYNGGYPASLKNIVDLLYKEWKKKPLAVATVSDGSFGGTQVITSILFSLWKIGAWVVPARFPVPDVLNHYDEEGNAIESEVTHKRAKIFMNEVLWCAEARKRMER